MAMVDGTLSEYNELLGLPLEDYLIKVDQYTRELKQALEYEEELKSR